MSEVKAAKPSIDLKTEKGREDRRQQLLAQAKYFERYAESLEEPFIGSPFGAELALKYAEELRRQADEIKK